jgi:hypothetical protein
VRFNFFQKIKSHSIKLSNSASETTVNLYVKL